MESWAEIVARAASATPHARRAEERWDRAELATRAQRWTFEKPTLRLVTTDAGVVVGEMLESVEIGWAALYHVEPVDPWPAIALGWVDRGVSYSAVVAPPDSGDVERFAADVEELVTRLRERGLAAVAPGWLQHPVLAWERVDALPGEQGRGPAMRGYRMSPEEADPVVARRTMEPGGSALLRWIWARLAGRPRRVDAVEVVLTRRFLYVRTRGGERLRLPASALRTSRRTPYGDSVYVLGRSTELLLVRRDGCELQAALDARVGAPA